MTNNWWKRLEPPPAVAIRSWHQRDKRLLRAQLASLAREERFPVPQPEVELDLDLLATDGPAAVGRRRKKEYSMTFGGVTYDPERDRDRLVAQLEAIRRLMSDGAWHTLPELAARTGAPEASISARLRDLRKPKFGGRQVDRRYVRRGLFEYRLVPYNAAQVVEGLPW